MIIRHPIHPRVHRCIGLLVCLSLLGGTAKALVLSCLCGVACVIGGDLPHAGAPLHTCCGAATAPQPESSCGQVDASTSLPACHAPMDAQETSKSSDTTPDGPDRYRAELTATTSQWCACSQDAQHAVRLPWLAPSRVLDELSLTQHNAYAQVAVLCLVTAESSPALPCTDVSSETLRTPSLYQIQILRL